MWTIKFLIFILIYVQQKEFQVRASSAIPENFTIDHSTRQPNKMKNVILQLAINSCPPNIMINVSRNGKVTLHKGPEVELLKILQQKLNIRYKIALSVDGEWGRILHGKWTGLIGMVINKETDIASGCLTLTAARYNVVSFSLPYDIQRNVIVTKSPEVKSKVYAVLMPFSAGVWLLVLSSLVSVTIVLYIIGQCYSLIFSREPLHFDKIFWYLLGTFSSEGGKLVNIKGYAAVVIISFWLTYVLVVQSCYSGTLMRVLSLQGREPAINSMIDIATAISKRGFKCGCIRGTLHQTAIMEMTGPLEIIKETMLKDKTTIVGSVKAGLKKVLGENYVFLAHDAECTYVAGTMGTGKFYMSKGELQFEALSFALNKEFPYTEKFNSIIRKSFEAGLINKWRKDLTFQRVADSFHSKPKGVAAEPLTITEMHGALMMCTYGLMFATIVLFIEQITSKITKMNRKRKCNLKR